MNKNKKLPKAQIKLQILLKVYNKTYDKINKIVDTLPNSNKICNCDDKYNMGLYEYDLDFNDGTATIVCLSCGGGASHL